jgi:serine/threonine protein kinase
MNENDIVDHRLSDLHETISQGVFPEDIFGRKLLFDDGVREREAENREEEKESLAAAFKYWRLKCDPKNFTGKYAEPFAEEAEQMLIRLYLEGQRRINEGEYGQDLSSDFRVLFGDKNIELRKFIRETETSEVYASSVISCSGYGAKVIAKIAREKEHNRFLENEIRVLRQLFESKESQTKHYSPLTLTFRTSDDRLGIIADYHADYYSLEEVRNSEKWKNGVPEKHMVWMLNRALSAIGFVHKKSVIKRNINPGNFLIRPRDHNLVLADWELSIMNAHVNAGFKMPQADPFTAPEIKNGEKAIPSTDMYSLGKLMIYILGGDPETGNMPETTHPRIQNFLKAFTLKSKWQRVGDAWKTHGELINLIEDLWGKRRFLKFRVF